MWLWSRQRTPGDFAKISFSSGWLMIMEPGVVAGQTPARPGIHVTVRKHPQQTEVR
jgi:hypothetical protein